MDELKPKFCLISETASKLARSSSVDVLHVRFRVYALRAIIVPANKERKKPLIKQTKSINREQQLYNIDSDY